MNPSILLVPLFGTDGNKHRLSELPYVLELRPIANGFEKTPFYSNDYREIHVECQGRGENANMATHKKRLTSF